MASGKLFTANKRYFCMHCNDYVSRSTYRRHQDEAERGKRMKMDDSSDEVGLAVLADTH